MWRLVLAVRTDDDTAYLDKHYFGPKGRHAETVRTWPQWEELLSRLLSIGGKYVATVNEEDMDALLTRGQMWPSKNLELRIGAPISCHSNSAQIYEAKGGKVQLVTGWALSKDDIWRQHTWLWWPAKKRVIETTVGRVAYFGYALNEEESNEFCENN